MQKSLSCSRIVSQKNLAEFFFHELSSIDGFDDMLPGVRAYLVGMMAGFARKDVVSGPLCLDVIGSSDRRKLQSAADSSLFLVGFMRDRIRSSSLPVEYYFSMGSSAYSKVAFMSSGGRVLFGALAEGMRFISGVLWSLRGELDRRPSGTPERFLLDLMTDAC